MAAAFKFIHASDLHLDQPMRGLTELPPHLKPALANAPYDAATKVFDLAVSERVDFVLLAGDLFCLESGGPRAAAFLLSQFQRLNDKGIQIYWSAGKVDHPDRWPASIELPENVVTFSSSIVEDVTHCRDGEPIATIFGAGHDPRSKSATDFTSIENDVFPITLSYGEFEANTLSPTIRYWAFGGRHKGSKLERTGSIVAYPGTTQGRSAKESGPHGCYLCRVDINGKLRIQTHETDTIRWMPQKVSVSENITEEELKNVLAERALKIGTDTPDQTVLIHWYLATNGDFNPAIRRPELNDVLVEWMRDEFGRGSESAIWTTHLTVEPPNQLPSEWYEEDTILGEYLRAVGRYQSDESINISLHEYLPNSTEGDAFAGLGRVVNERREEVLRQTALLGVQYLGAHKASEAPSTKDLSS